MSELQISLLVIGIAVVLAVYGYNWWQQRQYRRKFGAAFRHGHEDALYRTSSERPESEKLAEAPIAQALPVVRGRAGTMVERRRWPRDCALLDTDTDYIAMLSFKTPANAQVLAPLWRQRFDFGKGVQVCGLNSASGAWEKVTAESPSSYSAFKLALQLADRSGAVNEARLADFRDMARDMAAQSQAEAELHDVATARAMALELDNFCAEVDQMIGLNILPGGERTFSGAEIEGVAGQYGMSLQTDGAFHLLDGRGFTVFSLGDLDNAPFQHHTLNQIQVSGLTLLLDVPRVERPAQRFDEMAVLARRLAMDLHAAVVDDHRVALGEPGIAQIREQVATIENRMESGKVISGSAQARRLFS